MNDSTGACGREMPRYKCHKEVWALKIKAIVNPNVGVAGEDDGERVLTFSDEGYAAATFVVGADYIRKHKPEVGGYFVVYKDGYRSFSPADAFEEGYSRMNPESQIKPTIGRIVIYNHPGSADGKYPPTQSPAIIQAVAEDGSARLFVFGPKGQHMDDGLKQGDGPCQWNWPPRV